SQASCTGLSLTCLKMSKANHKRYTPSPVAWITHR
ncbi:tryptophan synthase, beta subunit, partial [Vibrio parahaemolyticus V-223/04]